MSSLVLRFGGQGGLVTVSSMKIKTAVKPEKKSMVIEITQNITVNEVNFYIAMSKKINHGEK